ncbi:multi-sensor signal transduction histidine kinase [Calothrix parasitica NIES-267]|uniref:histidine kinase n=1 Tax=Calothrix parasitica NIES-267 TaxID=1973488 RepID=A0A1Z4LXG1_9CYAN|nr:multi-sensor signal transduction histidine kinase [Calothrix parasitica NIES-267]
MLPEQQQRILGYFIEEATDHLNTIEQGLLNLQSTLNDPDLINEVFRAAHSIKGGAAMLGLSSIQRTSHRLEDCFKVLKDNPVKIDQKLESLFLGVSDTLKALLEHLSGPFGLTEETAETLMSEAEPVFGWLNEHLDRLVKKSPGESGVAESTNSKPAQAKVEKAAASGDKNNTQLQAEVLNKLRQILQLFKQPATPENRKSLQECTDYLAELGDNRNLSSWSNLCRSATSAIGNEENTYLTLAKIVITEIKQALELVLASKESEIAISEQLNSLLPTAEIELLELDDLQLDEVDESEELDAELFIESTPNDYQEAAAAEALFLTDIDENIAPEIPSVEAENNISSLFELSENIDDNVDRDAATIIHDLDVHGPEVGVAELNTLADLFEGESPELDESWQQEEIIDSQASKVEKGDVEANIEKSKNTDSEFADFLVFEEDSNKDNPTAAKEEMTIMQLFGEDFVEEDLDNLKDTASKQINNSQKVSDEEEINDLLELGLDQDNDNSSDVELDSLFETVSSSDESDNLDNHIDSFEDLNQTGSFENLFGESLEETTEENAEQQKEFDLSDLGDVGLDTLFGDFKNLKSDEGDGDLFDDSSDSVLDDSANIWEKTQIIPHEDVAKVLEENLIEATSSKDIFAEDESSEAEPANLELGDIDTNNLALDTQIDSIFSADAVDNLLESALTANEDVFDNTNDSSLFSSELDNYQQSKVEEDLFAISPPADNLLEPTTEYSQNQSKEKSVESDLFAISPPADNLLEPTTEDYQNQVEEKSVENDLFAISPPADNLLEPTTEDSQNQVEEKSVENDLFAISPPADNLLEPTTENSQNQVEEKSVESDLFAISPPADNLLEPTTEDSQNQSKEKSIENDLFAISPPADNLLEPTTEDSQIETPDNILEQESLNIDLTDSLQSLQSTELELTEQVNANSSDLSENLEDITTNSQAQLIDDLFAQDIPLEDEISLQATSEKEEITFLPFVSGQKENVVEAQAEENVLEKESEEVVDDFSQLESLLGQELLPTEENNDFIGDDEFAALENLLVVDNDNSEETATDTQETENTPPEPSIGDEFGDLEKLLEQANTSVPRKNTVAKTSPKTTRSAKGEQLMRVPVKHLDNLSNLVGELVVNRNTLEQDQERMRQSLDNLLHQIQNLSDVGARMQELYERSLLEASLLASRKDSGFNSSFGSNSNSDSDMGFSELEMDRFTPFHTLSQEMIELIVRVRESASDIDFVVEENERVARQFRQVTSQLQEGITRSRMEAFSQVTTRLERGVRDNSIKCGKQINLIIEGQDTLIDKMILQHLTDPLNHILNNAIAHGIETPEERESKAKPPQGTIRIRAFHQGNQTVISVSDDGAGIDAEKVKKKAVKVGLITKEEANMMSRMEVYELLFHSGFSTKDEADQLAGRGVGMDVVRTSISEIRGTINTDSSLGKGTTFTIRLPLTLSICKALCCVSDKARIAFSMDGVEDTLDMSVKEIQESKDGKKYIFWRDTKLPFRPLQELLTFNRLLSRGNVYGGNRDDDMVSVIIVRSANTMIALQIDQVLSEQEIVIKQFEGPAPKPIGVAGATVLGDGRIMPIVDVLELIDIFEGRTSRQSSVSLWDQKDTATPVEPAEAKIDPTVLIVDDSITVRELLSLTFSKAGYRVEQARDGQEAWDKLRSGLPCDIVFCDIEMPRCDGLELLSRIQKDDDLNNLPIAMLTSRGADKHRQMAIQLGASGYFTKPYLEEALLEAAVRMLKGEKLVASS